VLILTFRPIAYSYPSIQYPYHSRTKRARQYITFALWRERRRADARHRDAGDAFSSSRSGNEADARRPPRPRACEPAAKYKRHLSTAPNPLHRVPRSNSIKSTYKGIKSSQKKLLFHFRILFPYGPHKEIPHGVHVRFRPSDSENGEYDSVMSPAMPRNALQPSH
jgi:hypothetical protein